MFVLICCLINVLFAFYRYYQSSDVSGTPALVRVDPQVNFNWFSYGPAPCMRTHGSFNNAQTRTFMLAHTHTHTRTRTRTHTRAHAHAHAHAHIHSHSHSHAHLILTTILFYTLGISANFSARWTGFIRSDVSGSGLLTVSVDDSADVFRLGSCLRVCV